MYNTYNSPKIKKQMSKTIKYQFLRLTKTTRNLYHTIIIYVQLCHVVVPGFLNLVNSAIKIYQLVILKIDVTVTIYIIIEIIMLILTAISLIFSAISLLYKKGVNIFMVSSMLFFAISNGYFEMLSSNKQTLSLVSIEGITSINYKSKDVVPLLGITRVEDLPHTPRICNMPNILLDVAKNLLLFTTLNEFIKNRNPF